MKLTISDIHCVEVGGFHTQVTLSVGWYRTRAQDEEGTGSIPVENEIFDAIMNLKGKTVNVEEV